MQSTRIFENFKLNKTMSANAAELSKETANKKNPFSLIWWKKGMSDTQIKRNNILFWKWENKYNNFN